MKYLKVFLKIILSAVIAVLMLFVGMTASPIYRFSAPQSFSGDSIYNPYASLDTSKGWSRANFHTHTKVDKGINECPEYPDVVWRDYRKYGYDILSFSNHNAMTPFPEDTSRQIWVYEHGYNPLKFHKLVFFRTSSSEPIPKVLRYDNTLPVLPSQKQFMFDLLAKDADFIVFNHPDRTFYVNGKDMRRVTGYRFIEAYAGKPTAMRHWDEALTSGHYSYCLINDDCHDSGNLHKIAIRCSWLNTDSYRWKDVRETLLAGCYYSMSIPDFAAEGLHAKMVRNASLPAVKNIGLRGDTAFISLSRIPTYIKVVRNGGAELYLEPAAEASYVIGKGEPYVRFEAAFESGVKIYTNAFARCNTSGDLFRSAEHPIRWGATIMFNLLILAAVSALCYCIYLLNRKKKNGLKNR